MPCQQVTVQGPAEPEFEIESYNAVSDVNTLEMEYIVANTSNADGEATVEVTLDYYNTGRVSERETNTHQISAGDTATGSVGFDFSLDDDRTMTICVNLV